ncbi:phosphotransferase family protein [Virgisporangium aurantiacum]|uniref:Acyl-CoA dehydrogenase n=1 Tax=Virgisporangium aurantiacum TaxID=175570 RepID=A0A8J3YVQ2_9ACTN|nr:phosphotransferase family protein [Virgisporangium aurantiacum]GIJ52789.1 acyl-CoA dehydrogenase [Virgisporangium aurantiacum]
MTAADTPVDRDPPGLNRDALAAYLAGHRPDLATGPLRATLVAGGRSNLTYFVTDGVTEYVLRRPPLGHVLATAHDMGREHTVISALGGTAVPVPETLLMCGDDTVLGAPFYLMSRVPGEVLRTRAQTDPLPLDARRDLAHAMIDTLVALHRVDPYEVGLGEFGRPDGFLARQVRRWAAQLDRSRSRDLPGADDLRDGLAATVPTSPKPAIVHGDFRLDNLIVDPEKRAVRAVLDWEMATIGDPLTDLGLLVTYWDVLGSETAADNPIATAIGPAAGFPPASDLLDRYAKTSPVDLSALPWYTALACYKLAVILEGIHYRYTQGQTVGAGFDQIGAIVPTLIASGRTTLASL